MSSALSVRVRHLPDPLPHDEELLLKATPLAPSLQQRAGAHPPSCHTRRGVCTTPGVEASGRHWQLDVCFAGGPASGGVFPLHSPSAEGVDTGSFIALAGRLYGPPGVDGSEAPAICHLNSELEALHSREYDIPSGEFSQLVASRLSAPIRRLMGEWSLVIFDRDWRLVCVNAPRAEVDRCSDPTTPGTGVPAVCLPGRTVLDLSLARVLWFGARGQGILHSTGRPYWVRASTLLVGTGADELFGGYTRHRRAFERGGSTGLEAELRADLIRLPGRNFGRDDRAVGAWGRHLSAPFACERLMREVAGWPVACRAPFHEEDEGEGGKEKARPPALLRADKRPIRELCDTLMRENANSCDLTPSASANRPKRAMQFGSRVADPRENGADHAF
ncbi:hypothetical protein H696_00941 [Fonticula alba]|uniref:Asparagine synthetase domain-containing protein n=1 Tax=Fonticula alba TaxID=691883 RepID=A0A058ZHI8_FONAL|nr:hypothetical protein H696_00941 [Fonticula alba]KCV73403.1 hypothetical protein H696_00941 [Fonticula alba]|eukprot:XP_009493104.1 hypothetical protein H696_00941 [Fonticula alba]